jgi:hypothetical protein
MDYSDDRDENSMDFGSVSSSFLGSDGIEHHSARYNDYIPDTLRLSLEVFDPGQFIVRFVSREDSTVEKKDPGHDPVIPQLAMNKEEALDEARNMVGDLDEGWSLELDGHDGFVFVKDGISTSFDPRYLHRPKNESAIKDKVNYLEGCMPKFDSLMRIDVDRDDVVSLAFKRSVLGSPNDFRGKLNVMFIGLLSFYSNNSRRNINRSRWSSTRVFGIGRRGTIQTIEYFHLEL